MDALVPLGSVWHGGILGNNTQRIIFFNAPRGGTTTGPGPFIPSVVNISPHEDGKLLHKLPGVPCARSREPFLNESDGIDGRRKVGSDGEYLFVNGRATRVRRRGF